MYHVFDVDKILPGMLLGAVLVIAPVTPTIRVATHQTVKVNLLFLKDLSEVR